MAFYKTKGFKYFKNLIIGVGASLVMMGALGKINSEPWGGTAITIGLCTEALLFLLLGVLPPEKDYYWEKLYPGLDSYGARINALTDAPVSAAEVVEEEVKPLNGEKVDQQLNDMVSELKGMSKSLGSLKALQEVDFSSTSQQVETMNNFYNKLNQAMAELSETVDDTKKYKDQINSLNRNLSSLNNVYGNMLTAISTGINIKQ